MTGRIILDTNVISEVWKREPNPQVMDWFARQQATDLFITSITVAELYLGIRLMPAGARRDRLAGSVTAFCALFANRIWPFDTAAALRHSECAAKRRAIGRHIGTADAMIAGIALAHHASVATRNTKDFAGTAVDVVNPWEAGPDAGRLR